MKTLTAKLGKYHVQCKIEDNVSEEKAQDMLNRRVAEMYLEDEISALKGEIKFLLED